MKSSVPVMVLPAKVTALRNKSANNEMEVYCIRMRSRRKTEVIFEDVSTCPNNLHVTDIITGRVEEVKKRFEKQQNHLKSSKLFKFNSIFSRSLFKLRLFANRFARLERFTSCNGSLRTNFCAAFFCINQVVDDQITT